MVRQIIKTKDMIDKLNLCLKSLDLGAECVSAKEHRNMAFYDLQLNPGSRVKQLQSFAPEIALVLKSKSNPIIKSIPELGIVRLQVTTGDIDLLAFDDCYNDGEVPKNYFLPFLFGETDEGNKLWVDMSKNPHMLVAGATGSGKSSFLHLLIENIRVLTKKHKYDIALYLSDPKCVEFSRYQKNKYEYIKRIATDYGSTINMLEDINSIMISRYASFSKIGISSIEQAPDYFSKCFVIIDEVSYFMSYDKKNKKFEKLILDLAQRSRAAGIYLILATQRPSIDVITGMIKANFPARLACKVSSRVDSSVIIDAPGAECLLGSGDAILKNYNNDLTRLQIAYVK